MLRTSRERSVKIVATLGPASDNAKTIRELFIAGADVFRLNLSHGNHSELKERYQIIRELEKELGRPIGILADLQGPKLRCGDFENGDNYEVSQFCTKSTYSILIIYLYVYYNV